MADNTVQPTPPPLMTVFEAISQVTRLTGAVAKTERNKQGQGFMFRGIEQVLNAVSGPMTECGLVIVPFKVLSLKYVDVIVGEKKTPMMSTRLRVRYRLVGPDGSETFGEAPGEAFDSGDKGTAKAMSVAFRTFLIQTFALPTGERDPDEDTYVRAAPDGRTVGRGEEPDDEWPRRITQAIRDGEEAIRALWADANRHAGPEQMGRLHSALKAIIDKREATAVVAVSAGDEPEPPPAGDPAPEPEIPVQQPVGPPPGREVDPARGKDSTAAAEWWSAQTPQSKLAVTKFQADLAKEIKRRQPDSRNWESLLQRAEDLGGPLHDQAKEALSKLIHELAAEETAREQGGGQAAVDDDPPPF